VRSARGERTRQRILDQAELLYGARGVAGVSLREIRIAAGQRNTSALQFHFGGVDGLVRALAERHMPAIGARQERLRAELTPPDGRARPETLVEVMVRPWADYVRQGPGARSWVRVAAELAARPERLWLEFRDRSPAVAVEVGAELLEHLTTQLGPRLGLDRLMRVNLATLHLCADRARIEDAASSSEMQVLGHEAWATDLVDVAIAAMLAPSRRGVPQPG
jgi:AcrR family transcriptional regulator